MQDFKQIHHDTTKVYEAQAQAWDQHRSRSLTEKLWLDRVIATLPAGGTILDVGCGSGDPIARYLNKQGFTLTGVDAAPSMIHICQSRFPTMEWTVMDMRSLSLNQHFDGIIGWDSFFHLNPSEQRTTLQHFCHHLQPHGSLLLTVGHEAGEVLGQVEGHAVYHSSLSPSEYKAIVSKAGFSTVEHVAQDPNCGMRSLLFAHHFNPSITVS